MAKKTSKAAGDKPKAAKKTRAPKAEQKSKPSRKKIKKDDEDEMSTDDDDENDEDEGLDLDEVEDEMLVSEEEDEGKRETEEIIKMLRDTDCSICKGSSTKRKCKIRDDFGCPPEKANL